MVYKVIKTKFGIFLESLILTLMVLIIGFALGMYVEYNRTNKIIESYKDYEVEAIDLKLQNYYYQIMDQTSCKDAIEQNFIFADNLYTRGLELERYEEANQVSDDLFIEKKRYVLLKTELWLNSQLLKRKCNHPFDTVVYFYSADANNTAMVAQQKVISNTLKTVKENNGNNIVLIPIAGDMRAGHEKGAPYLGIVDMQRRIYNVTNLPSIVINEKIVLEGFNSPEKIQFYLTDKNIKSNFSYSDKI
jgi:hypothetical protein